MSETEPTKIKQMRKFILFNLNLMSPNPLQVRSLFNSLIGFDEHYDLQILAKDLKYLKQKNYIEYIDNKIGGYPIFEEKVVGLTSEGLEIAQRIRTDPALEI